MSKISILMSAYNAEKYIAESIESVLKQSFSDFDLIIVDKGSTDNTLSIIRSVSDKRIILLQNEHDFIGALNLGLHKAQGKYIACMDANAIMHIDRLKIQHAIMEEESDITVCGTWMIPFGDKVSAGTISQSGTGLIENPLIQLLKVNFMFQPTVMMRKDFLEHHHLQYKNYPQAEDYQLWVEIAKRTGMFYIESQPLLYYRVSEIQTDITPQKEQQETILRIKQEILEYLIAQNEEKHAEIATLYNNFLTVKEQNWLAMDDIFAFFYTFFLKNRLNIEIQTIVQDRKYWIDLLLKIATPILSNMSKGKLKKNMPLEFSPVWDGRSHTVSYMEAFGRLMAGLSPWLALPEDDTEEGKQRQQVLDWVLQSCAHAVNPDSPDYLEWHKESQPLVDAAYLANSFLRAPNLWEGLDSTTQQQFVKEFKGLRRIQPFHSNWLLFGAMIEIFLLSIDEEYDVSCINIALQNIENWYIGDGWYSDGHHYVFDYYNSFVIHPMYVEILEILSARKMISPDIFESALQRMKRYGDILERMISPEGTFPVFGRSITYRLSVFQPLALLAWKYELPANQTYGQVRHALTSTMKRMFSIEGNFDKSDFLQLGFAGHQPHIADYYTNTGSLYMTSLAFLPLGLPADHPFWTDAPQDWTSKKAWSGQKFPRNQQFGYNKWDVNKMQITQRIIKTNSVIDQPLISVVISVYNQADSILKNTLNSVVKQTHQNLEIWVVDDGSDKDMFSVVKEINDSRIHYHKLEHTNANVARNYGIEKSKGLYIAMLDADDVWLEHHIENCIKKIKETSADGLYGSLIVRNELTKTEKTFYARKCYPNETMIDYLLSSGYGAQTSTLFMTAKSAKDILWNPDLKRHQDYDFVVRYSKKYKWMPKLKPTVIYMLGYTPSQIDFQSCIRFIKENEKDISPHLYNNYHLNMLTLAKRKNESLEIIEHYQKESMRYKQE